MKIPLTKPFWGKKEERVAIEALRTSTGVGDGPFSKKLVAALQKLTGAAHIFPVTSCTHGLELAVASLELGPGDEVIMPSFTMTSTANAVALRGGIPVFADIEDTTFGIDPADINRKITKKTKGIIVVHYAGMPCRIDEVLKLAKTHNLFVVEDAAHAIGAYYKGKMLGTFGDVGVFSFHGTKNISCGEGGAVLTGRKDLAERMEIFRANGTNRNALLRGEVDKYSWVGLGSSYFLSDILASIVSVQLQRLDMINERRQLVAKYYGQMLTLPRSLKSLRSLIELPKVPAYALPNWHIFPVLFDTKEHSEYFITAMRLKGIEVSRHYVPLHSAPMGRRITNPTNTTNTANPTNQTNKQLRNDSLPVTEDMSMRLVRLPIYPGLTKKELRYIVSSARLILSHM